MAGKRSWKLEEARDRKKALARLFNMLMRDEIDCEKCRAGVYAIRAIEDSERETGGQGSRGTVIVFEPVADNTPLSERND